MTPPLSRMGTESVRGPFRLGPARVLLVDAHPVVRRGVASVVAMHPDLTVCGEADNAVDAMALAQDRQPHLAVIELSLREGGALPFIKRLSSEMAVKVLVFSHCDERVFAERAVRAGAGGFVSKDTPIEELITAMRDVLNDRMYLSEQLTERMVAKAVRGSHDQGHPVATLSNRELEVFELVGRGVPTRLIAQRLLLSPKTVETYRENIKLKLHLRNASELTRHAVQWILERS